MLLPSAAPCSQQQRQFIAATLTAPPEAQAAYNAAVCVALQHMPDSACLQHALWHLLVRHEVLRSVVQYEQGQPVQRVVRAAELQLPWHTMKIQVGKLRELL